MSLAVQLPSSAVVVGSAVPASHSDSPEAKEQSQREVMTSSSSSPPPPSPSQDGVASRDDDDGGGLNAVAVADSSTVSVETDFRVTAPEVNAPPEVDFA